MERRSSTAESAAPPLDVLIVGGGAAGLATALGVLERWPDARVQILEGRTQLGGNIRTLERDGCTVDLGPDALATFPKDALELCKKLGLDRDLIPPSDASRRVSIALGKKLHPMPEGLAMGLPRSPFALAATSLISPLGKFRAAMDLILPASESESTSLGNLVRRRLGSQVLENIVAPLVSGIYGGDADELDARVVMPTLAKTRGSLIQMLARAPKSTGGMLKAPRQGMHQLVQALQSQIGEDRISLEEEVQELQQVQGLWRVRTSRERTLDARFLVLATPAHAAAPLLKSISPGLSTALRAIRARTSASVVFAFDSKDIVEPDSSGFLVSRREAVCFQAATFVSRKWPGRIRPGRVVVRTVVDEERSSGLLSQSDEEVGRRVLLDLRIYVKVGEPVWTHVARHVRASTLPDVGYPERVALVQKLAAEQERLALVGASYDGPGLAGCARSASRAVASISLAPAGA